MILVIGRVRCEEEQREELIGLAKTMQERSRLEDGCIRYGFFAAVEDPLSFIAVEEWADREALDRHFGEPHLRGVRTRARRGRLRAARSRDPRDRRDERLPRRGRLEERLALAAVGRHLVDDLARPRPGRASRSARRARPPWRGASRRGRRPAAVAPPRRAPASAPRRRPPRRSSAGPPGRYGVGQAVGVAAARGEVAAAEQRSRRRRPGGARPAGEERRRLERERAVVVEQGRRVEARAGGELGHRSRPRVRARLPVPPPLTNSSSATSRTAADDRRAGARGSRRSERACMNRIAALRSGRPGTGRRPRRSGPRRPSARRARCRGARSISARHPTRLLARRGPASASGRPSTRPPSGHQPTSMSRQTRTGAAPAADRRLDQVEVRAVVDHQHRRAVGFARRSSRATSRDRRPVDGRVGDDDVLEALLGEPQRLRQREREHPAEAGSRSRIRRSSAAAAHRLRRDPDRLARRPVEHRRPRSRHIASRSTNANGGLDVGEDRVVARRSASRSTGASRVSGAGERLLTTDRDRAPGEVAEWLKALAC